MVDVRSLSPAFVNCAPVAPKKRDPRQVVGCVRALVEATREHADRYGETVVELAKASPLVKKFNIFRPIFSPMSRPRKCPECGNEYEEKVAGWIKNYPFMELKDDLYECKECGHIKDLR